jgi:TonB family protein
MRAPRSFLLALPALLVMALAPARALAQKAPAPASTPATAPAAHAPVVTPPVVTKNEGAAYPKQALDEGFHETVEVPLILTIGPTGAVTRAVVEKPVGHGFDEAALAAAQRLELRPATRDGVPVAARIRLVYRFTPPPAVLSGRVVAQAGERPVAGATVVVREPAGQERTATTDADGRWRIGDLPPGTYHVTIRAAGFAAHEADESVQAGQDASAVDRLAPAPAATAATSAAGKAQGESQAVEQVEVRGERPPREVTKRTLDEREIERIPGTGGDALRSLQNLPGVARPPSFAGLLIVRGSAPQDTQYFVDGTPVPLVYHFGGLSSVVPTEMLSRIDFYPGNFGAQYGRAMGGIVDVGLADPKSDKLHAMAEVDLIDTRAIVQGPLLDTGWRFAIAGRRSWFDTWLGPVLQAAGAGVSVAPVYYDYQAVLERDLGRRSSIRFAFFGSDDRLDLLLKSASASNPDLAGTIGSHTGFWRGQALWRSDLGDDTELRAVAAFGQDYINLEAGTIAFDVTQWPVSSRLELAHKLARRLTMNVGLDLYYAPYSVSAQLPPPPVPGQPPPGPFSAQPLRSTTATGSVFQPAMHTEWEATPWKGGRVVPGVRLDYAADTKAWDLSPRLVVRQDVTSDPRTTIKGGVGLYTQPPMPQETNPVFGMPGLVSNRSTQYDVGVEREVTEHVDGSLEGFYKELDRLVEVPYGNTGTGVVYGAETLLRYKPDERFFGWLAYTLSRSLRRIAPGMPLQVFRFDETHILTVLGSYRLGGGWELGARYRLVSGYMYTPDTYGFYDENIGTYLPLASYPTNDSRLPLFQSLDLRVDKTWKLSWGTIDAYLDVLNVFNNANVDGISYDYSYTHQTYANDLPILPSLGVRVEN